MARKAEFSEQAKLKDHMDEALRVGGQRTKATQVKPPERPAAIETCLPHGVKSAPLNSVDR
jgi:hypothetical protein